MRDDHTGALLAVQASLHTCLPSLSHLSWFDQSHPWFLSFSPASGTTYEQTLWASPSQQIQGEPFSPHLSHTTGLAPSGTGTPMGDSTQVCGLRFPLIPQRSSQGDRVRM